MKILNIQFIALLFAVSIFTISSCSKPDPDAQSAEDDARGGWAVGDAFALGNNEAGGGPGGKGLNPDCMTVDRSQGDGILSITFDNCDYRGAVRNGIIHVSYTVPNDNEPRGVHATITFEDYSFDNMDIEGTIASTYQGPINRPTISVIATNMKATFNDGKFITWSSNKTYTITEGFGDGDLSNNIIEINGSADGINREDRSYESDYDGVTLDGSCELGYPVSGKVTINSDKGKSVIDYGNGACDKKIEVTNSGITVPVNL
jgi:hypothetical protein